MASFLSSIGRNLFNFDNIYLKLLLTHAHFMMLFHSMRSEKENFKKDPMTSSLMSSIVPQYEKEATFFRRTEKLFSSDTRQSMKRRIVTEKLTEIYSQMQLHAIACV